MSGGWLSRDVLPTHFAAAQQARTGELGIRSSRHKAAHEAPRVQCTLGAEATVAADRSSLERDALPLPAPWAPLASSAQHHAVFRCGASARVACSFCTREKQKPCTERARVKFFERDPSACLCHSRKVKNRRTAQWTAIAANEVNAQTQQCKEITCIVKKAKKMRAARQEDGFGEHGKGRLRASNAA